MKTRAKSRVRVAASAAALAVIAVGASGCAAINEQATTMHYDASDGVSAGDRSDVVANNLMLVTNGDGAQARFIGHVANNSDEAKDFSIDFDGQNVSTNVKAGSDVNLQDKKFADSFTIDGSSDGKDKTTDPGLNVAVTVKTGSTSTDVNIPVVNGTIKDYEQYVPGGSDPDARQHLEPSDKASSEEN